MINVFLYFEYKQYFLDYVHSQPNRGRGIFLKLSKHLGCSSVLISQIFKGNRNLNMEQAFLMAKFLGLQELEEEYFLLLVQLARCGNHQYKTYLLEKLKTIQKKSRDLKSRLNTSIELDESQKSIFYSNWEYSAVRLATSINKIQSIEAISEKLNLPRNKTKEIIHFLLKHNLCIEENNNIKIGSRHMHLEKQSPYIKSRQISWRLKSFAHMDNVKEDELFYTLPLSINEAGINHFRDKLLQLISELRKYLATKDAETMACLNIDWFRLL